MNSLQTRRLLAWMTAVSAWMALSASLAAPGDPDQAFGIAGRTITRETDPALSNGFAVASALAPSGAIYVAARCQAKDRAGALRYRFCVAKYQSDGQLDTSFGTGGLVRATAGDNEHDSFPAAIALAADGSIIVGGSCKVDHNQQHCLIRLNTTGSLDGQFGAGGTAAIGTGGDADELRSLMIDADQKIVAAGKCADTFCIARFQTNGAADTSFGDSGLGIAVTSIGGANPSVATAFFVGRTALGGYQLVGPCKNTDGDYDMCLMRYTNTGTTDNSFGVAGALRVALSATDNEFAYASLRQPDGKWLIGGRCGNQACIVRLNTNGQLDASFGEEGVRYIAGLEQIVSLSLRADGRIAAIAMGANLRPMLVQLIATGAFDAQFQRTGIANLTAWSIDFGVVGKGLLQPDGKWLVVGGCDGICVGRLNADGGYDISFGAGAGGRAGTGVATSAAEGMNSFGWSSAEQHDGKIVTVGYCFENATLHHFCISRHRADGTPDAGFGGSASGHIVTRIGSAKSAAFAVVIQRDGKIVVGGQCEAPQNGFDFCLARYLTNGQLDASFGTGGTVVYGITLQQDTIRSLAIQADGKIVAAGGCGDLGNAQFCIARFLSNGARDREFANTLGHVRAPVQGAGLGFDLANSMAMQADGKFIVAGACFTPAGEYDFCSLRFKSDGTLDHSWGNQGSLITSIRFGAEDSATDVVVQPDGKVILVGNCRQGERTVFCAIRYQPDNNAAGGLTDTSYGEDGVVLTSNPSLPGANHIAYAAVLQQDGKLLIAGKAGILHAVARLHSDGKPDQYWGANSKGWSTDMLDNGTSNVRDLLLQRDGKVLLSGSCGADGQGEFCLLRLEGGPQNYKRCSADIDGDGIVTAHIDTLIVMRRMQGVIGPAVIADINFPPNAKRRTWGDGSTTDVRRYLREECGMPLPAELPPPTEL